MGTIDIILIAAVVITPIAYVIGERLGKRAKKSSDRDMLMDVYDAAQLLRKWGGQRGDDELVAHVDEILAILVRPVSDGEPAE